MLFVPVTQADAGKPTVLVVGDSLSAGYGMSEQESWVALLRDRLAAEGYGYAVVNASLTGDTTGSGLKRLPRTLALHRPAIVIIELGGNDGLRGFPLAVTRANLESMIAAARRAEAGVLLLGMRIPPNYGPRYAEGFHALFGELAAETGAALVPFLLEGIATDPALMQTDGVHPTGEAQPLILANVLPVLLPLIRE